MLILIKSLKSIVLKYELRHNMEYWEINYSKYNSLIKKKIVGSYLRKCTQAQALSTILDELDEDEVKVSVAPVTIQMTPSSSSTATATATPASSDPSAASSSSTKSSSLSNFFKNSNSKIKKNNENNVKTNEDIEKTISETNEPVETKTIIINKKKKKKLVLEDSDEEELNYIIYNSNNQNEIEKNIINKNIEKFKQIYPFDNNNLNFETSMSIHDIKKQYGASKELLDEDYFESIDGYNKNENEAENNNNISNNSNNSEENNLYNRSKLFKLQFNKNDELKLSNLDPDSSSPSKNDYEKRILKLKILLPYTDNKSSSSISSLTTSNTHQSNSNASSYSSSSSINSEQLKCVYIFLDLVNYSSSSYTNSLLNNKKTNNSNILTISTTYILNEVYKYLLTDNFYLTSNLSDINDTNKNNSILLKNNSELCCQCYPKSIQINNQKYMRGSYFQLHKNEKWKIYPIYCDFNENVYNLMKQIKYWILNESVSFSHINYLSITLIIS